MAVRRVAAPIQFRDLLDMSGYVWAMVPLRGPPIRLSTTSTYAVALVDEVEKGAAIGCRITVAF